MTYRPQEPFNPKSEIPYIAGLIFFAILYLSQIGCVSLREVRFREHQAQTKGYIEGLKRCDQIMIQQKDTGDLWGR